jgi:hypothetical protein
MAVRDAQRWLAESLMHFQRLEAYFVVYFALLHNQDTQQAGIAAWEAIENPRSSAFASLLDDLGSEPETSSGLTARLSPLLKERNWLVHRSLQSSWQEDDPGEFVGRVTKAAAAAEEADSAFYEFLLRRCESFGIPAREAEDKAAEVIQEWAAA